VRDAEIGHAADEGLRDDEAGLADGQALLAGVGQAAEVEGLEDGERAGGARGRAGKRLEHGGVEAVEEGEQAGVLVAGGGERVEAAVVVGVGGGEVEWP